MRTLHCLGAWLVCCVAAVAAQLPAKPARYFNDYAGVVSPETAGRLNRTLEDFEKQTSSQILVVIYPKLPTGNALEDFTLRAAEAWKPGQEKKDNGAILFIFRDDRQMRIEVGYGLEGAIPDLIAKRIIDNEIAPRFRSGNFDAGVAAGVNALLQAARGEYKGTGTTVASRGNRGQRGIPLGMIVLLIVLVMFFSGIHRQGTMYHRRRRNFWGGWLAGMAMGSGRGGWGGSRGGSSWGGGGGFSGGGGRFGGGGASGGW